MAHTRTAHPIATKMQTIHYTKERLQKKLHMLNCWRLRIWAWGNRSVSPNGLLYGRVPHSYGWNQIQLQFYPEAWAQHGSPKDCSFHLKPQKEALLWSELMANTRPRHLRKQIQGPGGKGRNPGRSPASLHWMAKINKMWSQASDSSDNQSSLKQSKIGKGISLPSQWPLGCKDQLPLPVNALAPGVL